MLPVGGLRVLALLALSALGVAAAARPPLDDEARIAVLVIIGAVAAFSARSSLLVLAARKRRLVVDAAARTHRLHLATVPAGVVGAALAVPLFLLGPAHPRFEVLCAGLVGAIAGTALARGDRRPKAPRVTSRIAWLVLDTALPAGCVAALVGVSVAFLRLHTRTTVEPGELARHLAVTTFLYAALLGLGGFFKAYGEQSAGLVIVDKTTVQVPGPLVVGGALGVAILFIAARVVPELPVDDVLVIKAVAGLVVGSGLSLLGALQGARAASLGLKSRRAA